MICPVTNTSDCISVAKVMLNGGKGIKQMKNRVAHLLKNAGKSPISGLFRHHLSIFGRQNAKFLLKTLGEIAGRAESSSLGNFIHTQPTFLKQDCCMMKANAADKCHRSSMGQSRQLFIKSCPLHTEILCQLFHAIFAIFQMLFYQSTHLKNQLGFPIDSLGCFR